MRDLKISFYLRSNAARMSNRNAKGYIVCEIVGLHPLISFLSIKMKTSGHSTQSVQFMESKQFVYCECDNKVRRCLRHSTVFRLAFVDCSLIYFRRIECRPAAAVTLPVYWVFFKCLLLQSTHRILAALPCILFQRYVKAVRRNTHPRRMKITSNFISSILQYNAPAEFTIQFHVEFNSFFGLWKL